MEQTLVATQQRVLAQPQVRSVIRRLEPYLYLLPALVFLSVFVFRPLVVTLDLSLYDWNMVSPEKEYVGLKNYVELLRDPEVWRVALNTVHYAGIFLLLNFALPLVLAVLVHRVASRWQHILRIVLFTPTVISLAVVALMWLWVFNPAMGVANQLLHLIGIAPVSWLSDSRWALPSVALVTAWKAFGYSFVLFLAGLVSISHEYTEAARVDGATEGQIFWRITWPLLRPTVTLVAVNTLVVSAEYVFVPMEILTQGGPNQASSNLIYFAFERAFRFFRVGLGSAGTVLIVLVFLGLTIIQIKLMERNSHAEG